MEFEYPDDAARALRQKTDLIVQGKKLKVIYSRETNGGYSNLYYQNVEEDVSKEEVHEAFKPFGEILQFKLLPQPGPNSNVSMGKGFVRYANRFQAVMAIKELNEKKVRKIQGVQKSLPPFMTNLPSFRPFSQIFSKF